MMDSYVLHIGKCKTNVLLTLDSTFFNFDSFAKTNEGVTVAIGNRNVTAEYVLTRPKLQRCSLGRCAILLCKFRKSDAGLYATTCFIVQWLDMVGVIWRTDPKYYDCNQECCCVDL